RQPLGSPGLRCAGAPGAREPGPRLGGRWRHRLRRRSPQLVRRARSRRHNLRRDGTASRSPVVPRKPNVARQARDAPQSVVKTRQSPTQACRKVGPHRKFMKMSIRTSAVRGGLSRRAWVLAVASTLLSGTAWGWEQIDAGDGIRVYKKDIPNSDLVAFRGD